MPSRRNCIAASVNSFCFFLLFGSIFCGCFFGIYYEFLKQYKQASCIYKSQINFRIGSNSGHHLYTQFSLQILVDGKTYPAFACEADTNRYLTGQQEGPDLFAYNYYPCTKFVQEFESCKAQQEIIPRWLCSDIGQIQWKKDIYTKCWYVLAHTDSTDPNDNEVDPKIMSPQRDYHYIQVIFDEKPWIPQGEYWAMMIVNLGLLTLLPLFFCVFISFPLSIYPMFYKKLKNRCLKFIRMRILVCWKQYDPDLWVDNRGKLMIFAMIKGKSKGVVKIRFLKKIHEYMGIIDDNQQV